MSFAQDGSVHLNRLGIASCPHEPVLHERIFGGDRPSQPKRLGAPIEAQSVVLDRRRRLARVAVGGGGGAVSWHVLPRPNPFSHLPAARTSCPVERERIMLIWLRRSPKLRNLTVDLWLDARDPIIRMHAVLLRSSA